MKPILVFDYDGTLHDTIRIYEKSFRKVFKWLVAEKYVADEEIPVERIKSWLGMNSRDMWESFKPDLPVHIREAAGDGVGKHMAELIRRNKAQWYPGAEDTLNDLKNKGYRMILLSNCKSAYRDVNWKTFSMNRWFEEFYDCESYGFAPKTEIIKIIEKNYETPITVIGDRKTDIDCARAIKGGSVGCLYGFGTKEELQDADILINDIRELKYIL